MRRLALLPLVLLLAGCAPLPVAPATDACTALDVALDLRTESSTYDLVATNTADEPCSITGYPTVQVLSTTGNVIAEAPMPTDAPPPVELAPGAAAYALIELVRGEVLCDSANTGGISVTLPGSAAESVVGGDSVLFCQGGDTIRVGSFRAEPLEGQEITPND